MEFIATRNLDKWTRSPTPVLVLVAVALVCFYFNLGSGSLKTSDEARYAEVAREMAMSGKIHTLEWNYTFYHKKPPLAIWLTAISYRLLGVGELAARVLSATCGFGSVLLTFLLGRRIFGVRPAFLGALVLCSMPMFLKFTRLGMLDGPLTLLVTAGMLLYLKSRETPKLLGWLGLVFGLALLTKSAAAVVLPATILLHGLVTADFAILRRRDFWLAMGSGFAIGVSWVLLQYGLFNGDILDRLQYHVVTRTLKPIEGHGGNILFYPIMFTVNNAIWGPVGIAAFALLLHQSLKRQGKPGAMLLITWVAVVFGLYSVARSKIVWYILPALPPLALASGWLIDRVLPRLRLRTMLVGFASVLGVHLLISPQIVSMDFNPEISAIVPEVESILAAEDTVFLYGVPANPVLFYTGNKIRRADGEIGEKLFVESVRERGRRFCFVATDQVADLEAAIPESFELRPIMTEGRVSFAEVRAHEGTAAM